VKKGAKSTISKTIFKNYYQGSEMPVQED